MTGFCRMVGEGKASAGMGEKKPGFHRNGEIMIGNMQMKLKYIIFAVITAGSIALASLGIPDFSNQVNIGRGVLRAESSNYEQAVAEYDKAISNQPDNIDAYINRAIAYFNSGDLDRAKADIAKGLELDSVNYNLNNLAARYYLSTEQFNEALYFCNLAVAYGPHRQAGLDTRALINFQSKSYYDCLVDCNRLIVLYPEDTTAYLVRGLVYARSGAIEKSELLKAIADFNKIIELEPENVVAYYNRGLAYKEYGDTAKAEADFAKVLELTDDPDMIRFAQDQIDYLVQT